MKAKALEVEIILSDCKLSGFLTLPEKPKGIVVFAHGSGSSRLSPRNQFVAEVLNHHHLATLLFDLLSKEEESIDLQTAELRFNIPLLAKRLSETTKWVLKNPQLKHLKIGYFGASTGAGAALISAAKNPGLIKAVVSRGGRPDLASSYLYEVQAPTLLIVGGDDHQVIDLNNIAIEKLKGEKKLEIVTGATHLFEEEGTLEQAAELAAAWFEKNLN